MKPKIAPRRGMLFIYRIIVALMLALVLVLAAGSLYALIRPAAAKPLFRIGKASGQYRQTPEYRTVNIFSGIGRLRIPTEGEPPATVILSISFPYPADDHPFAEELASRIGDFRSIATAYFASLPPGKLAGLNEEAAKAEILKQYNALLRLGKIETLYFGDLMVIE